MAVYVNFEFSFRFIIETGTCPRPMNEDEMISLGLENLSEKTRYLLDNSIKQETGGTNGL